MSDINLTISIMGHPKRSGMIEVLAKDLQKQMREAGKTPHEHLYVSMDYESRGIWWNARQAWEYWRKFQGKKNPTHHMVIQDDVEICRDFYAGAIKAIEVRPINPIQFFGLNRKFIEEAHDEGKHWIEINDIVTAQCIAMPVSMVDDWLSWCDAEVPEDFKHDDSRLGMYLQRHDILSYITVPNLCEHLGAGDSLIGQSRKTKVARVYIGKDNSALDIDWEKDLDDPFKAPKQPFSPAYKTYLKNKESEGEE